VLKNEIEINDFKVDIYSVNTVVVGSGAAGLNAADRLHSMGQKDIVIVTEGINFGTSRNTGSDKQTYYKLTAAGKNNDSVYDMAKTYYEGGAMDGDLALVEAALSSRSFYHLVELGVPFPHNRFGEYVGYKTDHDSAMRATSAGPYTSRYMTEKLENQVRMKNIKIFDGYQVIGVLTDSKEEKALGLLTLSLNQLSKGKIKYVAFNSTNVVFATGGPAGIYRDSVYPESQTGALGVAFEAKAIGKNLTESQFGLSSIDFRWNLSGTYQQVLPRYISTNQDGKDAKEFLIPYFKSPGKMLDAIFLKGYQWPFTPEKSNDYGSSLIDILVYHEVVDNNRRVWLDFSTNSTAAVIDGELDFDLLGEEGYNYLNKSDALFGSPVERLQHMNYPAYELYKEHGIDLEKDLLEIAVCAQHNNGGLEGNLWWESNISHFFPVGEVNGSHGVYRPGGSALNAGQVGSTRAALYITKHYQQSPIDIDCFLEKCKYQIENKIELGNKFINNNGTNIVREITANIRKRMSEAASIIRSKSKIKEAIENSKKDLDELAENTKLISIEDLEFAFKNYDFLITQYVYLSAIGDYIEKEGKSRGSYIITNNKGNKPIEQLPKQYSYQVSQGELSSQVQQATYNTKMKKVAFNWRKTRPLPEAKDWFENVWREYLEENVFK
jgi:succinate dehydrogenase/fumarate reductase flavoprotein subunit